MDIFLLLYIILLLTIILWNTDIIKDNKLVNYITILSVIVAILSYIIQHKQHLKSEEERYVKQVKSNWTDIEKMFMDNYPYLNRLYKQIYSYDDRLKNISDPLITEEVIVKENHMAVILIQVIDNLVQSDTWDEVFKEWFKSPILREVWKSRKKFYNEETVKYIDSICGNSCLD
jgi:c-di-AMP phosphodiesterase-like protein